MKADKDGNTPARMAALEGHVSLAHWLAKQEQSLKMKESKRE